MDFELENVLTQPWLASRTDQKAKWGGGATRGLPRMSSILVLLSPKHA
jgi:hypothetical protein